MSKMMRSDRKPPLRMRSPIRLRSRPALQSSVNNLQTPPGSLRKPHLPKPSLDMEEVKLRPEYNTISYELRALAKMVEDNFGGYTNTNRCTNAHNEIPLFERGRFYEEYSARRNERLKRKKGETGVEKKAYLGVRIESSKKRGEVKKFESARKMVTPLAVRKEVMATSRYSLRSSSSCKENKKPPLAMSFEKSVCGTVERRTAVRRSARK